MPRRKSDHPLHWRHMMGVALMLSAVAIIINMGVIAAAIVRPLQATQTPRNTHPISRIMVNGRPLFVEVVTSKEDVEQGLGDRESMPQDHGMLFVFSQPERYTFWMRHMEFPLDIIFLRDDIVVDEALNLPAPSLGTLMPAIHTSVEPADQVLELNAGAAAKYGLKIGERVSVTGT